MRDALHAHKETQQWQIQLQHQLMTVQVNLGLNKYQGMSGNVKDYNTYSMYTLTNHCQVLIPYLLLMYNCPLAFN